MNAKNPLDGDEFVTPRRRPIPPFAWIVVGLIVLVLLALLFVPSTHHARVPHDQGRCRSNLSQIGMALLLYSNDDPNHAYPNDFAELLLTQDLSSDVFVCPSTDQEKAIVSGTPTTAEAMQLADPTHCSYIACFSGLTDASTAADVLALEPLGNHDREGANVLFGDRRVEWIGDPKVVEQLLKDAKAGVRPVRIGGAGK